MSDCVTTNDEPIIGILTMKTDGKKAEHGDTFIPACFVKYLESAGARVVPIFLNQSPSYYKHIFDSINGILFPGGDVDLITSDAAEAGKILYEHAIQANDKGDIFPIWGTCWGFQFLFALACGEDLLTSTPALRVSFPLIFQKGYETSKLFKNAPDDIIDILANQNVTFNAHNDGITPTTFERNEKVKNFYKMLAINMDKINKEFISMIEECRLRLSDRGIMGCCIFQSSEQYPILTIFVCFERFPIYKIVGGVGYTPGSGYILLLCLLQALK
uniref:folate gamma-glutamyl hydrolase n=1 Tax=Saccoglossus kowalevskii TaxID=10224 RepID=A0ABM0MGH0_SACKO|nr:PREDICTED: gamma-glutamyl hydrolase-like [Saccoglossus kowalevskii]